MHICLSIIDDDDDDVDGFRTGKTLLSRRPTDFDQVVHGKVPQDCQTAVDRLELICFASESDNEMFSRDIGSYVLYVVILFFWVV